jgi:hypothetical protein
MFQRALHGDTRNGLVSNIQTRILVAVETQKAMVPAVPILIGSNENFGNMIRVINPMKVISVSYNSSRDFGNLNKLKPETGLLKLKNK